MLPGHGDDGGRGARADARWPRSPRPGPRRGTPGWCPAWSTPRGTLGGSLGLAILSTVAAGRSGGGTGAEDLTDGYAAAFRWGAGILLVAVVLLVTWMPRAKETLQAAG